MIQSGVYIIRCDANGMVYVGSARYMTKRIREHFLQLEKGIHRNRHLQRIFNEHGEDSFKTEVVLYCDPDMCEYYQKSLIRKLQPAFNIVHMGDRREKERQMDRAVKKFCKELARWGHNVARLQKMTRTAQKWAKKHQKPVKS
jgi:group I intron endonuclease